MLLKGFFFLFSDGDEKTSSAADQRSVHAKPGNNSSTKREWSEVDGSIRSRPSGTYIYRIYLSLRSITKKKYSRKITTFRFFYYPSLIPRDRVTYALLPYKDPTKRASSKRELLLILYYIIFISYVICTTYRMCPFVPATRKRRKCSRALQECHHVEAED